MPEKHKTQEPVTVYVSLMTVYADKATPRGDPSGVYDLAVFATWHDAHAYQRGKIERYLLDEGCGDGPDSTDEGFLYWAATAVGGNSVARKLSWEIIGRKVVQEEDV